MIDESLLKNVSMGLVAKDIIEDDVYVEVFPFELQVGKDGEITKEAHHSASVTDNNGGVANVNIRQTDLIKARWYPNGNTHVLTAPNVCKNEVVMLWKYSDADEYYWTTAYNQLELRKLEKRVIVVSNKASIDISPDALMENSYFIAMDSINKLVHIHTSTTDGEYTTYDIGLDTKEGVFTLTDGKENHFKLDSQTDTFTLSSNSKIITKTKDTTNSPSNSLTNNTNTKVDNVGKDYAINVPKYHVTNSTCELIATISDFIQAVNDGLGIGNMNMPVPFDAATQSKFMALKAKIDSFK